MYNFFDVIWRYETILLLPISLLFSLDSQHGEKKGQMSRCEGGCTRAQHVLSGGELSTLDNNQKNCEQEVSHLHAKNKFHLLLLEWRDRQKTSRIGLTSCLGNALDQNSQHVLDIVVRFDNKGSEMLRCLRLQQRDSSSSRSYS